MFKRAALVRIFVTTIQSASIMLYPLNNEPHEVVEYFVMREPQIILPVCELRHVLNSTSVSVKGFHGDLLDMPVIDFDAMLEFLFSDLDRLVQGDTSASTMAGRYILEEVLERDTKYCALLRGVETLTASILQHTSQTLLDYPLDHHAPHKYQLQQILSSGSLMLQRVSNSNDGA